MFRAPSIKQVFRSLDNFWADKKLGFLFINTCDSFDGHLQMFNVSRVTSKKDNIEPIAPFKEKSRSSRPYHLERTTKTSRKRSRKVVKLMSDNGIQYAFNNPHRRSHTPFKKLMTEQGDLDHRWTSLDHIKRNLCTCRVAGKTPLYSDLPLVAKC